MSIKIISYDLGGPESSSTYKQLIEKIKSFPRWAKPLESFWLVDTPLASAQIRDMLLPYLDNNDCLFVTRCSLSEWASHGLSDEVLKWLHNH